jgi:DeoR family transcriptional regulator of aga operon
VRRAQRLAAILDVVATRYAVDTRELARELNVSPATVRRDLALLDEQRLLRRSHGGAVTSDVALELPLRYRAGQHHEEKLRIAKEAATRVTDGSVVGLTGGTTTTEVAHEITGRKGLTIVTNALNISGELAIRRDLTLVVTGGTARPESYELVGPLADENLARFNLDVAFVGVDGISVSAGLTTHHETEAHTNRTMIDRARRTVVVADSSKLDNTSFARICAIEDVDELITDTGAEKTIVDELVAAGITVTAV